MREHMGLYRGKRLDNGEWVEGYFVFRGEELSKDSDTNSSYILEHDELGFVWHKVDPDTVGECTGLKDKNGKLIFEGDIFHSVDSWIVATGSVHYDEGGWCVNNDFLQAFMWNGEVKGEIIGNITDNPEILKRR